MSRTAGRPPGPGTAWLHLCGWAALTLLSAAWSFGWASDNRMSAWFKDPDADPGFRILETFGGDESILVRVEGFALDDPQGLAWVAAAGAGLAAQPAVRAALDPFRLPGAPAAPPREALQSAAWRPLAEDLGLLDLARPRVDFLLLLDGSRQDWLAGLTGFVAGLRQEAEGRGLRLRAAGHPLVAQALDEEAHRVEVLFAPLLAITAGGLVALALRSHLLAAVALLPALAASVLVRAALRLLGWHSNLVLAACSPLAFVLLLAAMLHLISAFRRRVLEGAGRQEAAAAASEEKRASTLLAAFTTATGFGVFLFSDVEPVRRLGGLLAASVLVLVPLALHSVPRMLAGLPARPSPWRGGPVLNPWQACAAFALRHRPSVLLPALLLGAAGVAAPFFLRLGTNALDYFPAGHPVREDFLSLESEGCGLSSLEVLAEAGGTGRWKPEQLAGEELGSRLRALEEVAGCFGPGDAARDLRAITGAAAGALEGAAWLQSGRLDASGRWARWTVRFRTGGAEEVSRVQSAVEREVRGWTGPAGGRIFVTGSLQLLLDSQRALVQTLGESLGLTALITGMLFLLVAGSRREWASAFAANLLPAGAALAAAAALGFPMDGSTVMVAAVILGLAVDNTFHLLHAAGPRPPALKAYLGAYARVGEAATVSSTSLALGFLTLALSGFSPTARFGLLCATGAVAALASDLFLLPVLALPRGRKAARGGGWRL